jgi:hypothetical protein
MRSHEREGITVVPVWFNGGAVRERKGRSYPWLGWQLSLLRREARKGTPYKVIARRVGRSYTSVQQKARKLGFRRLQRKGG